MIRLVWVIALFSSTVHALSENLDVAKEKASASLEAKFTFLYIVGIEGAGHHGMKELLEHLSHLSGHRVLWRGARGNRGYRDTLWTNHYKDNGKALRDYIVNDKDGVIANPYGGGYMDTSWKHTVIVEHISFPFEHDCRSCDVDEIGKDEHYDISWYYKAFYPLKETGDAKVKFLYITRDWWDLVASHKNFGVPSYDGDFMGHARVMRTHQEAIWKQYQKIKAFAPDDFDFGGVRYEWFAKDWYKSVPCPLLITAMFGFFEWENASTNMTLVEESCVAMGKIWHEPKRHQKEVKHYEATMLLEPEFAFPMLLNVPKEELPEPPPEQRKKESNQ
jgi:hypothetical protein